MLFHFFPPLCLLSGSQHTPTDRLVQGLKSKLPAAAAHMADPNYVRLLQLLAFA